MTADHSLSGARPHFIDRIRGAFPNLEYIVGGVIEYWPEHTPFIDKSLGGHHDEDLPVLEGLAGQIRSLISTDSERFFARYKWMCNEFNKEALHFLRTDEYKCKTFEDARENVYDNTEFMLNYMDGLLVSQLFWFNHTRSYIYYSTRFAQNFDAGGDYLEVGPGHGLFLAQAVADKRLNNITAWDVSEESLRLTGEALKAFGVQKSVDLQCRDVMSAGGEDRYNFIVISEVLEHLEQPREALIALREHLLPGGRMLVNFPVNSPAPDHIYLLRNPDEVAELVQSAGYSIVDQVSEPMTGFSVEEALKMRATITCLLTVTANG